MVSAFSVPKAKRQQKYTSNPGPGNYNPENSPRQVKPSDPKYSFGKDSRRQETSFVPGPGSYENKEQVTKNKSPSYSLSARKEDNIAQGIGPGQYDPVDRYSKSKAPQYSLGGRSNSEMKGNKVGPGEYQIRGDIELKKSGYHFSKDRRENIDKRAVPGPGSYEYENAIFKYGSKQDPSYGFGSRLNNPSGLSVPGPGSYERKDNNYSKIGGIMSREMRNSYGDTKVPGPGNYEPDGNRVKSKDPSWSLSKGPRDYMSKSTVVGPGAYEVDKDFKNVLSQNGGYNFGSQKRLKMDVNSVPGPGEYSGDMLKSRKSIKIGQKINDQQGLNVPGPGSYENEKYDYQSWMKGGGKYSVGKGGRDGASGLNVPGPGSYEQNLKTKDHNGKVTFSRDPRLKGLRSEVPGPGQYDLKPTFADVPSYLLPNKSS